MKREAVAVTIVVLVAASLGAGYLAGIDSRRTVTVNPTELSQQAVSGSFAQHMLFLKSRNLSAIVSQYEPNASVTWIGVQGPVAIETPAAGTDNISRALDALLYQPCGSHDTVKSFAVENITQSAVFAPDGSAVVNSTFSFSGNSSLWGEFRGDVSARDTFSHSKTGAFLISQENWNFTRYYEEYPVNPGMIC